MLPQVVLIFSIKLISRNISSKLLVWIVNKFFFNTAASVILTIIFHYPEQTNTEKVTKLIYFFDFFKTKIDFGVKTLLSVTAKLKS